jgi:mRNA-degrading endonuclease RelE of RelBE toxin-antitoxin system
MRNLIFTRRAEKDLANIPKLSAVKIKESLVKFTKNPAHTELAKIKGTKNIWRIREEKYRILLQNEGSIVYVLSIDLRKDIYKKRK